MTSVNRDQVDILYRSMQPQDVYAVSDMILRTFRVFIAPEYSTEGIRTFSDYVRPSVLRARLDAGALAWVAQAGNDLAGHIEMRNDNHVALLFVDAAYQRRGISRALLRRVLDICRARRPDLQQVTIHASPYALKIYERLGFRASGPQTLENGIISTPMILDLKPGF